MEKELIVKQVIVTCDLCEVDIQDHFRHVCKICKQDFCDDCFAENISYDVATRPITGATESFVCNECYKEISKDVKWNELATELKRQRAIVVKADEAYNSIREKMIEYLAKYSK